jgi:hypothetical protein
VRNKTAVLAVDLVESLFGKSTLMRKPKTTSSERLLAVLDAES